jgi:hypothetical protein
MAQVVQHLPSKCKTLSSNPDTIKKNTNLKWGKNLSRHFSTENLLAIGEISKHTKSDLHGLLLGFGKIKTTVSLQTH